MARNHFQFGCSDVNGSWPIILKFAESTFMPSIFPRHLQFFLYSYTLSVPCLRTAFRVSKYLFLAMGYLLPMKISGDELNLP